MLYQELLDFSKKRLDEFFSNVTIFENQFTWSDFNAVCFAQMYRDNSPDAPVSVKELKEKIPELKDICKKCGDFLCPRETKAFPGMM